MLKKPQARNLFALFGKDRRTLWHNRLFSALAVGSSFSPIDLFPDFIPVLGYKVGQPYFRSPLATRPIFN
ncbi:MAG: DUF1232 domain-containing protein [Anaerolineales bacterium]|nr:DUF1232 domain-containing protein [Anaerolineales bacterium]